MDSVRDPGPVTSLVVDDSTSMRQMVAFTLREAGYHVVEGANGAEGLAQLATHEVGLIISDVNMPVMDGLTFVRQVRAQPRHRQTPILMLTTELLEKKKQEGKAAGANGWIVKPFDPDRLLAAVSTVMT